MTFVEAFAVIEGSGDPEIACMEATGLSVAEFERLEAEAEAESAEWDALHRAHGDDLSLRDYGLCSVCL